MAVAQSPFKNCVNREARLRRRISLWPCSQHSVGTMFARLGVTLGLGVSNKAHAMERHDMDVGLRRALQAALDSTGRSTARQDNGDGTRNHIAFHEEVSLTFANWNHTINWLRRLEALCGKDGRVRIVKSETGDVPPWPPFTSNNAIAAPGLLAIAFMTGRANSETARIQKKARASPTRFPELSIRRRCVSTRRAKKRSGQLGWLPRPSCRTPPPSPTRARRSRRPVLRTPPLVYLEYRQRARHSGESHVVVIDPSNRILPSRFTNRSSADPRPEA